ncbi:Holliday junction branch migration protein RuvA [Brackiella oedipodis]|uniref:Holliday junction branch migration protein RuvA n=1 Tax=Brackiella oedipodis TaxID=124225 RepID=UPI00048E9EA0|nr:Holliday junction branch migration protein RuvA [Brackiella oedipodis]
MIGRISGILLEKTPPLICVDVNGVGYDIDVPMNTFYNLPDIGAKVSLYTHLAIRDDAHQLFGFANANDRATFRALIKVSGIGTRMALAILSGSSTEDLSMAVERQDSLYLTKIPGIGKKTAERLLLELRGKLSPAVATSAAVQSHQDILNALLTLGYADKDARRVLKELAPDVEVAQGIKQALKLLSS